MANAVRAATPPPPAYAQSSQTNDHVIELPAYAAGPLFSNYQNDIKEPPEAHAHESKPASSQQGFETLTSLNLGQIEAGKAGQNGPSGSQNGSPSFGRGMCGVIAGCSVVFFIGWLVHHYN